MLKKYSQFMNTGFIKVPTYSEYLLVIKS